MTEKEPKLHFNVGGPRGWTTACGIESSSFTDKPEEWDEVDCQRCLKKRPVPPKPRAPINTPGKFTLAREHLGLTKAGLARTLRLGEKGGEKTIRRIEQGQDVPGPYQVAMEAMLHGFRPRGFGE